MEKPLSLDQQYSQACLELQLPENPFIFSIFQEAALDDDILTKNITIKIAGNNRLIPVVKVTDEDFKALAVVFLNNAFLTGLDLRYNRLTDDGAALIGAFLQGTDVLFPDSKSILGVLYRDKSDVGMCINNRLALCIFQDNRTLRYLNLMFNDIGTAGAEFITKALHRNETLIYLRMTGNKIDNKGGMHFAAMMQINSTLQKLDLGDCDLGTQSLIAVATVLNHNESIKAINLNRPILYSEEEESTVHLALMLRANSTLVELHLCKHEMKNFGAERLCDALYENHSLRYLDLSCNKITRDGVIFLGKLLKLNDSLEILDLNFNRIEDDGAFYLSEALALYNRTLQALAVTNNNITGKGLVALSEAMKTNPVLSYIYIWGNKIDESACVAFADLLQSGRLKPTNTDVDPYVVDGHTYLAELSHGLKRHYYWTPSYGEPDNKDANASLAIAPVDEHL